MGEPTSSETPNQTPMLTDDLTWGKNILQRISQEILCSALLEDKFLKRMCLQLKNRSFLPEKKKEQTPTDVSLLQ